MYDAIVVGARCAGSPTAMLLARSGYNVLLVDKATFPSDIMSTHYIHQPGVAMLKRWGVLDALMATGCPPITNVTLSFGDVTINPPPPPDDAPMQYAICPRRTILDKLLVDAAVDAGAELREGFSVREVVMDGDRATGVRGSVKGGDEVTETARIVIGADGLHSKVAAAVQPKEYDTKPTLSFAYYAYWSGFDLDGAELHFGEDAGALVFPTHDGKACIATAGSTGGFHEFRKDVETNYLAVLEKFPSIAERLKGAKREERFIGTNDQPNYFRKPYGPGWALVGDSGYHRDFATGLGITDAFRDVQLLADAIDAGFSERQPLDEALAGYEQRRNEIAKPLYDITCEIASGNDVDLAMFMQFGAAMQAMQDMMVAADAEVPA